MTTVRQFVDQMYRLIDAHSPTVPITGNDLQIGIQVVNQLLNSYAATGLNLTIAKEVQIPLSIGQQDIIVGPATFLPTPDITIGRLANITAAWLLLDGVTYPLIDESRDEFLASWKFDPLQGLPRFIIMFPDTEVVRIRLYPSPSQFFLFNLRGKFQLNDLTANSNMNVLPMYYQRYLLFAGAKDVAMYKGRADAWTEKLEQMYREALDVMQASSEVNLDIAGDKNSLLNGSWRVMAGI